ncbi:RND family efflux transporter MFP subunit [Rhodovulum imhoffii]|uniref:RND family efflux transporter MFP subunit n=1 Tax=Rhodovulum imhoffii TaxID=365340 RepID=A0A2T5BSS3_9RHOB|nr:efflux RND transporter periplasmic adaptor subunit [Rhodovulum imhoffii]MBK5934373.1 efflux transporter periplasmic adaptor subunit [Rhodovulum imhoffii]PTN02436.1 RND family efflux transporter MFP subunit [Rhodovulum imhoffii]
MRYLVFLLVALATLPLRAAELTLTPTEIQEWKAVYGEIETRDRVPARARLGGTIVALDVTEGDRVAAGQILARVQDEKLSFRLRAVDAQIESLNTQIETARTDLSRGESLRERGVVTVQRLDQLRTQVDILEGRIESTRAERRVIEQQVAEGDVLAPETGVVLSVPVSRGSVVTPGEVLADIGGGGAYVRLAVPERHATTLTEGGRIAFGPGSGLEAHEGRLAKVYPRIEGGRVLADIEVPGLEARFVGRRVPVRLPVGMRPALLVPQTALTRTGGLDFVTVTSPDGPVRRTVVPGQEIARDGTVWREILTGLRAGDTVVLP